RRFALLAWLARRGQVDQVLLEAERLEPAFPRSLGREHHPVPAAAQDVADPDAVVGWPVRAFRHEQDGQGPAGHVCSLGGRRWAGQASMSGSAAPAPVSRPAAPRSAAPLSAAPLSAAGCSTRASTRLAMNRAVRTTVPPRVTSMTSTTPRPVTTSTRRPARVALTSYVRDVPPASMTISTRSPFTACPPGRACLLCTPRTASRLPAHPSRGRTADCSVHGPGGP